MLLTRPEHLAPEHRGLLARLTAACPEMTALAAAVGRFAELLTPQEANPDRLPLWITQAPAVDLPHLHAFTRGLKRDRDAVNAALTRSLRAIIGRPGRGSSATTVSHRCVHTWVSDCSGCTSGRCGGSAGGATTATPAPPRPAPGRTPSRSGAPTARRTRPRPWPARAPEHRGNEAAVGAHRGAARRRRAGGGHGQQRDDGDQRPREVEQVGGGDQAEFGGGPVERQRPPPCCYGPPSRRRTPRR